MRIYTEIINGQRKVRRMQSMTRGAELLSPDSDIAKALFADDSATQAGLARSGKRKRYGSTEVEILSRYCVDGRKRR